MGQTLPHGIYLPDEGERNCYDGLAGNWQLLDGAVGTVAEHTSALAGKAPLVHTHTKSDITDLFNSANTWNAENTYTNALLTLNHTTLEKGVLPASNQTRRYRFTDKNNADLAWIQHRVNTSGDSFLECYVVNKFSNGQLSAQGSEIANIFNLGLHSNGSRYFTVAGDVYPDLPTRVCNLGTATNKWKTLNGINPGALSLPDTLGASGTENVNYFNVIGYLNNTGTIAIIPTTATYDGWLYINAKDGAGSYITVDDNPSSFGTSVYGNNGLGSQSVGLLCLICPIRAGHLYSVRIKSDGIVSARIYPAQGNV